MKKTTDKDYEEVTIRIKRQGKGKTVRRKVVNEIPTRTFILPQLDDVLEALNEAPCEIRLATGDGKEAIRLYRVLTAKLDEQFIAAQTMGDFRHGINDNRKLRFTHGKKTVAKKDVERVNLDQKAKRTNVTPDTLVTCPACGTEFRVGKSLS